MHAQKSPACAGGAVLADQVPIGIVCWLVSDREIDSVLTGHGFCACRSDKDQLVIHIRVINTAGECQGLEALFHVTAQVAVLTRGFSRFEVGRYIGLGS